MSPGDDAGLADLLSRVSPGALEADNDKHRQLEGAAGLADELSRRNRTSSAIQFLVSLPAELMVASLEYFGTQAKEANSPELLQPTSSPEEVAEAFVETVASETPSNVHPALQVVLSRPGRISDETLGTGSLAWLQANDPTTSDQLATLLEFIDRARRAGAAEEAIGAAADDGTLMHLTSFATRNSWFDDAAGASMLHLTVRPAFPTPVAARESAQGDQLIRQSLANPAVNPEVVTAQSLWLQRHKEEAVEVILAISADPSFQPWVDHQLSGLWEADALTVTGDQYLAHWKPFQGALSSEGFERLTRDLLTDDDLRPMILDKTTDPELALLQLQAVSSERGPLAAVRKRASAIVSAFNTAAWEEALRATTGTPMTELALSVVGTKEAPANLPSLADALHDHFQRLADGEEVWQPGGKTFADLSSLLSASTRKTLASQLCAALEPRDGKVDAGLFEAYGPFLASEKDFRTHQKLPNFLARAVALDEWGSVEWLVGVGQEHKDTLQKKGREAEIEHLSSVVSERLGQLAESAPETLVKLADLLGLPRAEA